MATNKHNKDRVNLTVDPALRIAFDSLLPVHGKSLSEFLEDSIRNMLGDVAPDVLLEIQIAEAERNLATMKENLVEARFIAKKKQAALKIKNTVQKEENDLQRRLNEYRIAKYEENKDNLACMINNHTIDWTRIMDVYEFKSRADAKMYIMDKLASDGLVNKRY